ncbi:cupin domain-containing protein [Rhodoferax sp.]|uniref:cupin domain-containing protein n=1 Tax=Rhodoferax sp. TaxID=50421 RepID=UPI0027171DE3|nr:cupin domain-containing protein [Rhodoferax sp.]MDO9199599.1 cupin domain-containing protein [Rhodoferax sp.]
MSKSNLNHLAERLPTAWQSSVIGKAAGANIKVLRMDSAAYPEEVHEVDEALLVIDGVMNLDLAGELVSVGAGELFLVPAGQPHAVVPGSHGTLIIIDQ